MRLSFTRVDSAWIGAGLVVLTGLVALPYALLGPGFILDDWFTLRNAHFDGAWSAAGDDQRLARPGAWIVYALVFGPLGDSPFAVFVFQVVVAAASAVLLYMVARTFLDEGWAAALAAVWVLLPNHGSLLFWASGSNIAVALLLFLGGCLLLARRRRLTWVATACFVASSLCYEATLPAAGLATLVTWYSAGRQRLTNLLLHGGALAGALAWLIVNWHPAKRLARADLSFLPGAHFGKGIAGWSLPAAVLLLIGVCALALVFVRRVFPSFRQPATAPERLLMAGLAIVAVGTLPFIAYLYAPVGAGDRLNVIAGIGTASCWTAIVWWVSTRRRAFAAALAVLLVSAALATQFMRQGLYSEAASDADKMVEAAAQRPLPSPPRLVFGPCPQQQQGIVALLDVSNVSGALQVRLNRRDVAGSFAFSPKEFDRVPAERRFDVREVDSDWELRHCPDY